MTNKTLPILLMAVLAIPFAGMVHADVDSSITVGGAIVESYEISPIRVGDTTVTVTVTLNPNAVDDNVDQRTGAAVSLTTQSATVPVSLTLADDLKDTTDGTIVLQKDADISSLNVVDGTQIVVTVQGQSLKSDSSVGYQAGFGVATDTKTVTAALVCAYSTLPALDYGSMTAGDTKSVTFTPTVDADVNEQPTGVTFAVGDWQYNSETVVEKSKTTIDGNSGADDIVLDSITSGQEFAFETTLDFTSATAYINSIGNTITQTTTITPTC